MTKPFYITTAIDYVNGSPHIGHAYEKIITDIIARWQRINKKQVFFLTGTDDNAQKNAQAAKEYGLPTLDFVNKNAKQFEKLCKEYEISNDSFIRTTSSEHIKKSQEIVEEVYKKGLIYEGIYEGLYCDGCEAFITEKELVKGKCPEHNKVPRNIKEKAYFFKISKFQKQIINWIKKDNPIIPEKRANEILFRLENEELKDLCISRANAEWGIDLPFDNKFKIYVWFDALINYITGAGKKESYWPADVQTIGKGILWFHSVIWPAILLATNRELPKKLWVHGYLTVSGEKMSKSLGNVVNPLDLAKIYPIDSIRYFLARENSFENDGDFSIEKLKKRHNDELANKLGNLVSRVSALAEKYGLEKTENKINSKDFISHINKNMECFSIDKALNEIFSYIDKVNEFIQESKPWETKDPEALYEAVFAIRNIAILLSPFMPQTAEKIAQTFNFLIDIKELDKPLKSTKPGIIKKSDILFQKIQ